MQLVTKKLSEIKPYPKNPRNNDDAVDYVAQSIKEYGFNVPIVLDADNVIICGHTRYKAAKKLGIDELPCIDSFFALNLDICPSVFQGDFEDDIEYRLKLAQMGIPAVQVQPLMYSKTGQARNKDLTGCRAEYLKAGLKRGEHMKILYGDLYDCKMRRRRNNIDVSNQDEQPINFKHYIKPFKVGVVVNDMDAIKKQMQHLLKVCSKPVEDKAIIKEKKVKLKA